MTQHIIRTLREKYAWPPHTKSWLIGKDPDAGRDWEQDEKGTSEDGGAWWAAVYGVAQSRTWLKRLSSSSSSSNKRNIWIPPRILTAYYPFAYNFLWNAGKRINHTNFSEFIWHTYQTLHDEARQTLRLSGTFMCMKPMHFTSSHWGWTPTCELDSVFLGPSQYSSQNKPRLLSWFLPSSFFPASITSAFLLAQIVISQLPTIWIVTGNWEGSTFYCSGFFKFHPLRFICSIN